MAEEFDPDAVRLAIAPFMVADIPAAVKALMVISGADEVGIRPEHGLLEVRFSMRSRRTRSEVLKRRRPGTHRGYDPGRSTTVGVGFPSEGALFAPFDLLEHPERFYELFPEEHWDDVVMAVEAIWNGMLRRLEDEVSAGKYRILARVDRANAPVEEIALSSWRHFLIDDWEYGIASAAHIGERLVDVHLLSAAAHTESLNALIASQVAAQSKATDSIGAPPAGDDEEQILQILEERLAVWPVDKPLPGASKNQSYVEAVLGRKVNRDLLRRLHRDVSPDGRERGRKRNPKK